MPLGFVRLVAISCAAHPEPTTGASYEGVRTVGQAPAAYVEVIMVDAAKLIEALQNNAPMATSSLTEFMVVVTLSGPWTL